MTCRGWWRAAPNTTLTTREGHVLETTSSSSTSWRLVMLGVNLKDSLDDMSGESQEGHVDAGGVSMVTASRVLFLPSGVDGLCNLTPTILALLCISVAFILVYAVTLLLQKSSNKLIGRPRNQRHPFIGREKHLTSSDDEELGLDHKAASFSCSRSRRSLELQIEIPARNGAFGKHPYLLEAPRFPDSGTQLTTMAKKAAASALIRTQARKPTPHAGPSATVSLRQGRYTGVLLSASAISRRDPAGRRAGVTSSSSLPRDVEAWRGIPYAQTTAGENRFRPPIPLSPYDVDAAVTTQAQLQQRQSQKHGSRASSFTADRFGQMCPGSTAPCANVAFEGEDCLNLNVYRPVAATEDGSSVPSLLPVVIYVHGGAFNAGSGTERDMASFVGWAETPVLGVNFNYRVGALGFPSSSAADEEGGLNLGLRDQRMLFEWVRDNIAEFGGDPGRVTVMGMSAGAHSVSNAVILQEDGGLDILSPDYG